MREMITAEALPGGCGRHRCGCATDTSCFHKRAWRHGTQQKDRRASNGTRGHSDRDQVPVRPQEFSDSHATTRKARSLWMRVKGNLRSDHTNLSMAARAIYV